ncbi:glycosyltransferase family 2 protein [Anaerovoracaceae bacterium SGI.195]
MNNKLLNKLSVIIPVYNIEKYIERCVESVLDQNYSNLEIILVDDGSTDRSSEICDSLACKHNIIRAIHKSNGGQSSARNLGIDEATGEYIVFIDGDDFIEKGMFEELMNFSNSNKYDVVGCHHKDDYDGKVINDDRELVEFECNGIEALQYLLEGKLIPGTACAKIIKKEILRTIRFPIGKIYEDVFFTTELLLKTDRAHFTTKAYYHYWHRPNSTTTENYSDKSWDIIESYEFTYDKVIVEAPHLEKQALFRLYWAHFVVLDRMLMSGTKLDQEKQKMLIGFIKHNFKKIISCEYFSKGRKLLAIALMINTHFYKFLLSRGIKRRTINK